jgi:hypothetical protein
VLCLSVSQSSVNVTACERGGIIRPGSQKGRGSIAGRIAQILVKNGRPVATAEWSTTGAVVRRTRIAVSCCLNDGHGNVLFGVQTRQNLPANGAVWFVFNEPFVNAVFMEAVGMVAREDSIKYKKCSLATPIYDGGVSSSPSPAQTHRTSCCNSNSSKQMIHSSVAGN